MNDGNFNHNGSDLDKDNILKPTFGTLAEKGHNAFKAYLADLEELFLSRCEVTRRTPIVFNKPEVTLGVRPNPSPLSMTFNL
jgi:hypothetical protein